MLRDNHIIEENSLMETDISLIAKPYAEAIKVDTGKAFECLNNILRLVKQFNDEVAQSAKENNIEVQTYSYLLHEMMSTNMDTGIKYSYFNQIFQLFGCEEFDITWKRHYKDFIEVKTEVAKEVTPVETKTIEEENTQSVSQNDEVIFQETNIEAAIYEYDNENQQLTMIEDTKDWNVECVDEDFEFSKSLTSELTKYSLISKVPQDIEFKREYHIATHDEEFCKKYIDIEQLKNQHSCEFNKKGVIVLVKTTKLPHLLSKQMDNYDVKIQGIKDLVISFNKRTNPIRNIKLLTYNQHLSKTTTYAVELTGDSTTSAILDFVNKKPKPPKLLSIPQIKDDERDEGEPAVIETTLDFNKWWKHRNQKDVYNHNLKKGQYQRHYEACKYNNDLFVKMIRKTYKNDKINIEYGYVQRLSNYYIDNSDIITKYFLENVGLFLFETLRPNKETKYIENYTDVDKLMSIYNSNALISRVKDQIINNLNIKCDDLPLIEYFFKTDFDYFMETTFEPSINYISPVSIFYENQGENKIRNAMNEAFSMKNALRYTIISLYLQMFKHFVKIPSIKSTYYDTSCLYLKDNALNMKKVGHIFTTAILLNDIWLANKSNKSCLEMMKKAIQMVTFRYTNVQFRTLRLALNVMDCEQDLIDCFNNIDNLNGSHYLWNDLLLYTNNDENIGLNVECHILAMERGLKELVGKYNTFEDYESDDAIFEEGNEDIERYAFFEHYKINNHIQNMNREFIDYSEWDRWGYESKLYQINFKKFSMYHTILATAFYNLRVTKDIK